MSLNPLVQQRELLAGQAYVLLADRAVVEVTGQDRLKWLHDMLSQNLVNLAAGSSAEALLLDPQGHVEVRLQLLVAEESVWLTFPSAKLDQLFAWFTKTKFRSQVAWRDATSEFKVLGSWEKPISALAWQDPWPATVSGGYKYAQESEHNWNYFENLVPVADFEAGDFKLVPLAALDALRIAAHRPSDNELDEKSLPHELDLLATAVHLSKGCYRGQESVAKVHNLGHPPRRLVLLHLDGSEHELPEPGCEISVVGNEQIRGKVTSAAQHFEMGPVALALVARSVPETAGLLVHTEHGLIAANQEVIVPASAGQVVDRSKFKGRSLL